MSAAQIVQSYWEAKPVADPARRPVHAGHEPHDRVNHLQPVVIDKIA